MSRLLTRHGNRIGTIFFDGGITRIIPPKGGRLQVLRLLNDLFKQPQLPKAPFTNLSVLVEGGLNIIKKRSLVFIISDFISAPGWEKSLALLNQKHEVLGIHLWDPREMDIPDIGSVILEDTETGEQLFVDTHDSQFRKQYAELNKKRRADLSQAFKHAGVDMLSISTEEDLVHAIVRFATLRRQRRN
jgi:uncharacterized protein (DUF58 family)